MALNRAGAQRQLSPLMQGCAAIYPITHAYLEVMYLRQSFSSEYSHGSNSPNNFSVLTLINRLGFLTILPQTSVADWPAALNCAEVIRLKSRCFGAMPLLLPGIYFRAANFIASLLQSGAFSSAGITSSGSSTKVHIFKCSGCMKFSETHFSSIAFKGS